MTPHTSQANRFIVTSLVLVAALFFTLVGITNILDWNTNFEFVQHVLSMDSLFSGENFGGRAITDPVWHTFFYIIIICWELLTAGLLWKGAADLLKKQSYSAEDFDRAKKWALYGLGVGMLLWFLAFITVGGEWFLMWRSDDWSGIQSAFRMFTIMGITLIALNQTK